MVFNLTSNAGPIWNPNLSGYGYLGLQRYPHIGILNESNNTNPLNASITVWAPTLAGTNSGLGWCLVGTHKMDNTVTNMVDTIGGHDFGRIVHSDGKFWGVSFDHPNYTVEEYTDTAIVWKGTMNFYDVDGL